MISIDDYNPKNIELANLIKKYGLESETIFFIECFKLEAQRQIEQLSKAGFQSQSHTCTHSHLTLIDREQAKWEIEESKKIIESITGKECNWLCLPRGRYANHHIKMALDAGYKYVRSTKIFNLEENKTGLNDTTIHACPIRPEYQGKDWVYYFDKYLEKAINENGNFKFWMHAYELDKFLLWNTIEDCLKKIVKSGVFTK